MGRRYVPCLVCDPEMQCKGEYRFLNGGGHLGNHSGPKNLEKYREWIAEHYPDIDKDHPIFHDSGALTLPQGFWQYSHLFERK